LQQITEHSLFQGTRGFRVCLVDVGVQFSCLFIRVAQVHSRSFQVTCALVDECRGRVPEALQQKGRMAKLEKRLVKLQEPKTPPPAK